MNMYNMPAFDLAHEHVLHARMLSTSKDRKFLSGWGKCISFSCCCKVTESSVYLARDWDLVMWNFLCRLEIEAEFDTKVKS